MVTLKPTTMKITKKYFLIISIIFIFLTFNVFRAQGEGHIKNLNEKQEKQGLSACLDTKTEEEILGCVNNVYGYNVCHDLVKCCRWLGVELNITTGDFFGNFNENNNEVKKYFNVCNTDEAKNVRGMEIIKHVFKNGITFAGECEEITDSQNTVKYFGFNKKIKEVCFLSVSKMWNVKNSFIFYYLLAIGLVCVVFAVWKKIKPFFFNHATRGFLSGTMISLIMFLLIFLPMIFVGELSYLSDTRGFQNVEDIVEVIALFLYPISLPFLLIWPRIMPITKFDNYIVGITIGFIMTIVGLFIVLNVAKNRSKKLFWILLLIFILLYMGGLLLEFALLADSS